MALEQINPTAVFNHGPHLAGALENIREFIPIKLIDRKNILTGKAIVPPFAGGHFVQIKEGI
jgi:hypothetical protein